MSLLTKCFLVNRFFLGELLKREDINSYGTIEDSAVVINSESQVIIKFRNFFFNLFEIYNCRAIRPTTKIS